jgi:hypothetical protein
MDDADREIQPAVAGVPHLGSALSEGRSGVLASTTANFGLSTSEGATRLFPQIKAHRWRISVGQIDRGRFRREGRGI